MPIFGPPPDSEAAFSQWFDLRADQRRILLRSLAVSSGLFLISLGLLFLVIALPAVKDTLSQGGWLLVAVSLMTAFLLGALLILAITGVRVPQFLTPQGIAVSGAGISLVQDAKWWFSGRLLHLPWSNVYSITPPTVVRHHRRLGQLVLHLRDVPPQATGPQWAVLKPTGAAGPMNEPSSPLPRLYLVLSKADHSEFLRAVEVFHPDLPTDDPTPPTP